MFSSFSTLVHKHIQGPSKVASSRACRLLRIVACGDREDFVVVCALLPFPSERQKAQKPQKRIMLKVQERENVLQYGGKHTSNNQSVALRPKNYSSL